MEGIGYYRPQMVSSTKGCISEDSPLCSPNTRSTISTDANDESGSPYSHATTSSSWYDYEESVVHNTGDKEWNHQIAKLNLDATLDSSICAKFSHSFSPIRCEESTASKQNDQLTRSQDTSSSSESTQKPRHKRGKKAHGAARNVLLQWLTDHIDEPYPTLEEKSGLSQATGMTLRQVTNWMSNMRKRNLVVSKISGERSVRHKRSRLQEKYCPSPSRQPEEFVSILHRPHSKQTMQHMA